MVKQVWFRHLTGSTKPIPGLEHSECSPKLRTVSKREREIGREVPVLEIVPDHVVKVTLANEDYIGLTDEEKNLPQRIQDKLEDERVAEWRERVKANEKVRNTIALYASQGEVEVLGEFEKTEQEALVDGSLIVSLSDIAIADHIARGLPVPEHLINRDLKTERIRAAAKPLKSEEPAPKPAPKKAATKK